jgi:hypothetical protein
VSLPTLLNCLLILAGAIMLVVSIVRAHAITGALAYVASKHRSRLARQLAIHRLLMACFVVGYLVVLALIGLKLEVASDAAVSVIFFLGAVFVLIGVNVQERLSSEVQRTLRGIVPICAKCKQIRLADRDPADPAAWRPIEAYIAERTDAAFSHGLCPHCYAEALSDSSQHPHET